MNTTLELTERDAHEDRANRELAESVSAARKGERARTALRHSRGGKKPVRPILLEDGASCGCARSPDAGRPATNSPSIQLLALASPTAGLRLASLVSGTPARRRSSSAAFVDEPHYQNQ
jgi:hypothetical protein